MKIQNHIFQKRNERANSKMHNEPQSTTSKKKKKKKKSTVGDKEVNNF